MVLACRQLETASKIAHFTADEKGLITQEMIDFFSHNGFLVLEDFCTTVQCNALIKRAAEMVQDFERSGKKSEVFTTSLEKETERGNDFLESAARVSYFFEEEALDEAGQLKYPFAQSINKLGHALHDVDSVFETFSYNPKIATMLACLGCEDPIVAQSMYIFKQSLIGGRVRYHQDATYMHASPNPAIGIWFALEDATLQNGCLWAIPGGHNEPLREFFGRDETNNLFTKTFDSTPWDEEKGVPLEVSKGSIILLHGMLPHASEPNQSTQSRHAYTLHLVDRLSTFEPTNWIRRPADLPFRRFGDVHA
jgi:phytanoyl-CoA hydroxylase